MKQKEYNVYIDESGDDGINKGSKYFILTALLVEAKEDVKTATSVSKIKESLEMKKKKQLHWNKVKGMPKKYMILSSIQELEITIINIVINTTKIKLLPTKKLYNHFSGYLYERICWFLRDKSAVANIFVSSRGNMSKESLTKFLKEHPKLRIEYSRINQIKVCPNSKKNLLQLADCCCSSLWQALEYKDEKHLNFIFYLKDNFYMYKGKYIGYGLKFVPSSIENQNDCKELIAYLEK